MARKNTITVELIAKGDLLEKLEQASGRLRAITSSAAREADRLADHSDRAGRRISTSFDHAGRAAGRLTGFLRNAAATAAGFLTANVIGGAFSRVTGLADDFAGKILSGAREGADAQLFLGNAIKETAGNLAVAQARAAAFAKDIGLSQTAGQRLTATSTLGLQGTGIDPDKFLRRAADLLASRGRSLAELETVIGQVFAGSDEGIGRLLGGGENPSTFFNAYAASLGKAAANLTDVEKKLAVVNVIMAKGAGQTGAATARLGAFGGALDQISSLIDNVSTKIGDALARNVGVLKLIEGIRGGLLGLLSSDTNFDAFIQKIADGFVNAAGKAIDFAAMVGRGVNEVIGFVKKAQIATEQALLGVQALARDVFTGIQLIVIDAIQFSNDAVRGIIGGLQTLIGGLLNGVVGKVRKALDDLGPIGRAAIPGANLAHAQFTQIGDALNFTKTATDAAGAAFDSLNGKLEANKSRLTASAAETSGLYDKITDLSKGYAAVDKETAAANKATDKFFNSLKPALPDFAKFNPRAAPAESTKLVTRLIESGDSLTGFQEAVRVGATAANAQANATIATKTTMEVLNDRVDALAGKFDGLTEQLAKGIKAGLDINLAQGLTGEVVPAGGTVR